MKGWSRSRSMRCAGIGAALFVLLAHAPRAMAHEARPAYLEIDEAASGRYELTWRTPVLSGMRLPVSLKLPEDVRNIREPAVRALSDSLTERRAIELPGGIGGRRIDFVGLEGTITDVLVRVQMLDGNHSTTVVRPSQPWIEIAANPGRVAVVGAFVMHGIHHILFGFDHLLFVLGLLLIVKDRWMLLKTVTAFTVAHSITLAIATLGYADAPVLPVNAAIALSILFLGPEIVRSWRGETSLTLRKPWLVAGLFGLLHGFGFAGALTSAGLPKQDLPLALLGFNAGVEIGQVAFVLLVVLLERSFHQLEIRWPRWVELLPGYLVGSLGAFWTIERTAILIGVVR
jgi:hydrogenase/urease accessory protein HupE